MRRAFAATLFVLSLAACGDNSTPAQHEAHNEGATSADAMGRTPSPSGAKVFIVEPKDGATVKNPDHREVRRRGHEGRRRGHRRARQRAPPLTDRHESRRQHRHSCRRPAHPLRQGPDRGDDRAFAWQSTRCRTCSPTRATFRLIRLCNPTSSPSPSNSGDAGRSGFCQGRGSSSRGRFISRAPGGRPINFA